MRKVKKNEIFKGKSPLIHHRRRLQAPAAGSLHRSRSREKTAGTKNWLAFIAYRLLHGRCKLQHLAQKKWNNARRSLNLWIILLEVSGVVTVLVDEDGSTLKRSSL